MTKDAAMSLPMQRNHSLLEPAAFPDPQAAGPSGARAPRQVRFESSVGDGGRIVATPPNPSLQRAGSARPPTPRLRDLNLQALPPAAFRHGDAMTARLHHGICEAIEYTVVERPDKPADGAEGAASASGSEPRQALLAEATTRRMPIGDAMMSALHAVGDAVEALSAGPCIGDAMFEVAQGLVEPRERLERHMTELRQALAAFEASGRLPETGLHGKREQGVDVDAVMARRRQAVVDGARHLLALCEDMQLRLEDRRSYLAHGINDSPRAIGRVYEWKGRMCRAAEQVLRKRVAAARPERTSPRTPGRPRATSGAAHMPALWLDGEPVQAASPGPERGQRASSSRSTAQAAARSSPRQGGAGKAGTSPRQGAAATTGSPRTPRTPRGAKALSKDAIARFERAADALRERAGRMDEAAEAHAGTLGDVAAVLGRKMLGGLAAIGHFATWVGQKLALSRYVDALLGKDASPTPAAPALATPEVDEQTILEAALVKLFEEAGLSKAQALHEFAQEMHAQLNDQEWRPIVGEIQMRVGGSDKATAGSTTMFAYSEIAPAASLMPEYEGKGVNCYCDTEGTHAVNLAYTELRDGAGRRLFSAVRHGVNSAFGLVKKNIPNLSDEELANHVKELAPAKAVAADQGIVNVAQTAGAVRDKPQLIDDMRQQANHNRADEVIAATVLADPELLQRCIEAADELGDDVTEEDLPQDANGLPEVDLLSISLLTPDHVRTGVHSNEKMMLDDQLEAWKSCSGARLLTVRHPDDGREVRLALRVNPMAVNYGVNQGAVKGFGPLPSTVNLVSGWNDVEPVNEAALALLVGDPATGDEGIAGRAVAARRRAYELGLQQVEALDAALTAAIAEPLEPAAEMKDDERARQQMRLRQELQPKLAQAYAELATLERDYRFAQELLDQVQRMRRDRSYRRAGSEPYKMPARLALLADMAGVKVAFNCKSGKDRTGELDAEVKFLRLQMELTGHVPEPDRRRTPQEQELLYEVIMRSGNIQYQRLNTGYAGYKLNNVPEVFGQYGAASESDPRVLNQKGASGYTEA